jgi:ATP-dependent Clp protease ATP-binding subunit ClpA
MRELERRFAPEFRNRIDEVVLFSPLTVDEEREIASHYLAQLTETMAKEGKTIAIDRDALDAIAAQGYSVAYGARFLKRLIDERVKVPISAAWRDGSRFRVRLDKGEVVVGVEYDELAESGFGAYGAA